MWPEVAAQVGADGVLGQRGGTAVERSGRAGPQGAVERVRHVEVKVVEAAGVGQIPFGPAVRRALGAQRGSKVRDPRLNARQESLRVNLRQVPLVVSTPEKGACTAVAPVDVAMGVQAGVAARHLRVPRQHGVLRIGIAKMRVDAATVQCIRAGAVRGAPVAQFGRQVNEAVARQRRAVKHCRLALQAIPSRRAAPAQLGLAGMPIALEHDIDDARDGIGAVLRRGAVAQHLDPLDCQQRDGVQVRAGAAAADGAIGVQQGTLVQALTVHQHQHLVRVERAQRERRRMIRTVRYGGAGVIEARHKRRQRLRQPAWAHGLQLLRGIDIGRNDGIERTVRAVARTHVSLRRNLHAHQLIQRQFVPIIPRGRRVGQGGGAGSPQGQETQESLHGWLLRSTVAMDNSGAPMCSPVFTAAS